MNYQRLFFFACKLGHNKCNSCLKNIRYLFDLMDSHHKIRKFILGNDRKSKMTYFVPQQSLATSPVMVPLSQYRAGID